MTYIDILGTAPTDTQYTPVTYTHTTGNIINIYRSRTEIIYGMQYI